MKINKFFQKKGVAIVALIAAIVAAVNIGILRADFFENANFNGMTGILWFIILAVSVSVCAIVKGVKSSSASDKEMVKNAQQKLNGQKQKIIEDTSSRNPSNFQKNTKQYQYNTQSTYKKQNVNNSYNNSYNANQSSFSDYARKAANGFNQGYNKTVNNDINDKFSRGAEKFGEKVGEGVNKVGVKIEEIFGNSGNKSANPYSRSSHDGANPYSSTTRTSAKTGGNYYGQQYNPSSDGDVRSGAPGQNGYYSGNNRNVQSGNYYGNGNNSQRSMYNNPNNVSGGNYYGDNSANKGNDRTQNGIDESAHSNYFNNEPGASTYRSGPLKKK